MSQKKIFFSFMLLLLSACSGDKGPERLCPQVAILRALEAVEDHGRDSMDRSTLVASAKMESVKGSCSYEDKGVDITFDLEMAATKGPRLGSGRISFPFFVSIVEPMGEILSKEIMTADFVFPDKEETVKKKEPLHVFLPLEEGQDAFNYRVLLGFQLTEAQLKFARE